MLYSPSTAQGSRIPDRYDRFTIVLHWTTAALVVFLFLLASPDLPFTGGKSVIDLFPNGQPRIVARSLHITFGVVMVAVLLTRLFWRFTSGERLPHAEPRLLGAAAVVMHYTLYIVLAAVLLLGLGNAWARGDSIFGLFKIPAFDPTNRPLRQTVEDLHGLAANMLLILAAAHALAALLHHYILRDDVLRRMLRR